MNWPLFGIAIFLALAIDASIGQVLAYGTVAPSVTMVVVVFVVLHAPRAAVPWIGWGVGMLVDLLTDLAHGPMHAGPMLGPNALGWCFGAYLIGLIRSMLFKRQLHTVAALTVLFALGSSVVTVFVYAIHELYEPVEIGWSAGGGPASELLRRALAGLSSGLLGLVLGPILMFTHGVWAFRTPLPRAMSRRA